MIVDGVKVDDEDEDISDTLMQTCEALAHEDKKAAIAKKEAKAAAGRERAGTEF